MTIMQKAEKAMQEAVKRVVAQHKKDGCPLAIWEKWRVKKVFVK